MKFTLSATVFLAALGQSGFSLADDVCPEGALYTVPQCCVVDVLGLASLHCKPPSSTPESPEELRTICGKRRPFCCSVRLAGQGLLCTPAIGK
ncbi:fungal hydrophobin-domain-containing protein [Cladorrhinum sp. PSN332]|nr:fungal hydrophobin-domain-containing protein [Cladorrhinum sp. PSN332]